MDPDLDYILVIDLGTTYFKASIFDAAGEMKVLARTGTPYSSNTDGRREIDLRDFHDSIAGLVHELDVQCPGILAQVSAVTFASQTNSFVLLGARDAPLTPIIVWNDQRANGDAFDAALSTLSGLHYTTGVPALTHEFMVAKLLWCRNHIPDTVKNTKKLCLISDYFTLWLTGKHVTEAGAAALTGLVDIHSNQWWAEAIRHFQIDPEWLAEVARAGTGLGAILPERAELLGLPKDCRLIVGCLDQYAGAIGVGNVLPGGLAETTGTVLATVKCTDRIQDDAGPDIFQGPAFAPATYYQMVFGNTSANWLEDYRNTLPDKPSFSQLDKEAAEVPPGAEGFYLPPNTDPAVREAILAERARTHRRGHAVRGILESVSFALADQVALQCPEGTPAQIACAGGAARSRLWLQIKADVLNTTMVAGQSAEPASLGAAILAMHAVSGEPIPMLTEQWVKTDYTVSPDESRHRTYAALHAQVVDT